MRVQCQNCKKPVVYNVDLRRWLHKSSLENKCQMKFFTPIQYIV